RYTVFTKSEDGRTFEADTYEAEQPSTGSSGGGGCFIMSIAAAADGAVSPLEKGISAFRAQQYERAAKEFRLVRKQKPSSSLAAYYLGSSLFHLGDYAGAASNLRQSLRMNCSLDGPVTRHYLALCFFRRKLYLQADAEFQKVLEMDPKTTFAKGIRAQREKIKGLFKNKIPDKTKAWYYAQGMEAYRKKSHENAADYLRELYRIDKNYRNTREVLAACCNHRARYDETVAVAKGSPDAALRYQAGYALFMLAEYKDAAKTMEAVWKEKGLPKSALYAGCSYARLGDRDKAREFLDRAVRTDASLQPRYDFEMGVLLFKAGKTGPALARLQKVIDDKNPSSFKEEAQKLKGHIEQQEHGDTR
ncbi:tetratricopeptide repeat protein, partial [Planctomycetota bacterium]